MLTASGWLAFAPVPRLGEADIVVAFVVAVGGLSSEALDMAAPEVEGAFPVSSNRRIRDFKSSNASHTVDGAGPPEADDSVPSTPWFSMLWRGSFLWASTVFGTSGEELYMRLCPRERFWFRYVLPVEGGALVSATDCLRRYVDETSMAGSWKLGSWKFICRGVIGDCRKGARAWDRAESSTMVAFEVGLSRTLER